MHTAVISPVGDGAKHIPCIFGKVTLSVLNFPHPKYQVNEHEQRIMISQQWQCYNLLLLLPSITHLSRLREH